MKLYLTKKTHTNIYEKEEKTEKTNLGEKRTILSNQNYWKIKLYVVKSFQWKGSEHRSKTHSHIPRRKSTR